MRIDVCRNLAEKTPFSIDEIYAAARALDPLRPTQKRLEIILDQAVKTNTDPALLAGVISRVITCV